MAKLTAKARSKIPAKKFGVPGKREFPVEDKDHAHAALIDIPAALRAGHITKSEAAHIRELAHNTLDHENK